jgi:hypothetical protein
VASPDQPSLGAEMAFDGPPARHDTPWRGHHVSDDCSLVGEVGHGGGGEQRWGEACPQGKEVNGGTHPNDGSMRGATH